MGKFKCAPISSRQHCMSALETASESRTHQANLSRPKGALTYEAAGASSPSATAARRSVASAPLSRTAAARCSSTPSTLSVVKAPRLAPASSHARLAQLAAHRGSSSLYTPVEAAPAPEGAPRARMLVPQPTSAGPGLDHTGSQGSPRERFSYGQSPPSSKAATTPGTAVVNRARLHQLAQQRDILAHSLDESQELATASRVATVRDP